MQLPPIPEDSAAAQRVDESGTHYAWFLTYLALERPRTSAAVAREIGRHETTVRKRAGQYAWRHRAELWEWERRQEQAADLRGMATQVAAETASAAWAHASNLRSRAYDLDPERIPPREVAPNLKSMSDVALDLGRYVADLEEQAAPVSAESRELRTRGRLPRPSSPSSSPVSRARRASGCRRLVRCWGCPRPSRIRGRPTWWR